MKAFRWLRPLVLGLTAAFVFATELAPGGAERGSPAGAEVPAEGYVWGPPSGGVRLGIDIREVPAAGLSLFTFTTAARNDGQRPVKIAFGDWGGGPQHPFYAVLDKNEQERGGIIPHSAYCRKDPHNPQPAFPMELPPGKAVVLYRTTFVPPLAPGEYRIFARLGLHIPAQGRFVDGDKNRLAVVEQTRGVIGPICSGTTTIAVRPRVDPLR